MQETRCHRCGAVFPSHHEGAVCPYCGAEAVSKLRAVFSHFARYWLLFALVVFVVLMERPWPNTWAVMGLFAALVLAGFLVLGWGRIGSKQRPEEPLPLDLGRANPSGRPEPAATPLQPPKVPEKWRALLASRPPREVYLPFKVWKNFVFEGVTVLFTLGLFSSRAAKHPPTLRGFLAVFLDPAGLGALLVYGANWAVRLKKIFTTRAIVRDGEVTMAYTTDRSSNRAKYQFWSQTGQIFERRTALVKRNEFLSDLAVVPVFYLAADPRKSVALYGTEFLIRLPENSAAQDLRKAPASA
jgi:DNA-directed RNA polymerase subunit RPC12/RpoP